VLEILQRHDAKATFFLIGERTLRHPEVVAVSRLTDTRSATIT
jgi:peptidoglycan/xylan/chitin deacetylase (PgdA/CDA1 family)